MKEGADKASYYANKILRKVYKKVGLSEKQGRFVFYGAMVAEGIIALIWAAAGCSLYKVIGGLNVGLATALQAGQSAAIYDVCIKTMGSAGVILAMIGVVVCPKIGRAHV